MDPPQPTQPLASGSGTENLSQRLIRVLGIPSHLVGTGKANLQTSYQKYLAFLQAKDKLAVVDWQGKKPPQVELIQLFASKSYFFLTSQEIFSKGCCVSGDGCLVEGKGGSAFKS